MNLGQLHQDLGKVQGELRGLRGDMADVKGQLAIAVAYIQQQKGARRATIAIATSVAGVAGTLAGLAVTWFVK